MFTYIYIYIYLHIYRLVFLMFVFITMLTGALGSVVGNPFDVLKTRMMTAEGESRTKYHVTYATY